MYCPFCQCEDTRVLDSRTANGGAQIRRRRQCLDEKCVKRFTTREETVLLMPKVVKRNKARTAFSEDRLRAGIERALEKRPLSSEQVGEMIENIKQEIRSRGESEVETLTIGKIVMKALHECDRVAYIRFASVYRRFEDPEDFSRAVETVHDDDSSE